MGDKNGCNNGSVRCGLEDVVRLAVKGEEMDCDGRCLSGLEAELFCVRRVAEESHAMTEETGRWMFV